MTSIRVDTVYIVFDFNLFISGVNFALYCHVLYSSFTTRHNTPKTRWRKMFCILPQQTHFLTSNCDFYPLYWNWSPDPLIPCPHDLTPTKLSEVHHTRLYTNGSLPWLTIDGTKSFFARPPSEHSLVRHSMCRGPSVPKVDWADTERCPLWRGGDGRVGRGGFSQ